MNRNMPGVPPAGAGYVALTPTFEAVWACARVLLRGGLLHGEGWQEDDRGARQRVRATAGGDSIMVRDAATGAVLGGAVGLDAFELARRYVDALGPARATRSVRVQDAFRRPRVRWRCP